MAAQFISWTQGENTEKFAAIELIATWFRWSVILNLNSLLQFAFLRCHKWRSLR